MAKAAYTGSINVRIKERVYSPTTANQSVGEKPMSIIRGALRYMTVVMMRNLLQRLTNNGAVSEKIPPARPEIVKMIPNAPGKRKKRKMK